MGAKKVEPRLLKGFRDFPPKKQAFRLLCIRTLQDVFDRGGYLPIDTPILEHEEILLGKGGGETDKQVYRFQDNGKRNVVMRFDLTVPFARYSQMNKNDMPIPFFRSQIGKVFRGENTQKGRYREFMQCDFDIIGMDHESLDFAILQTIVDSFDALHLPSIKIHISHRGLLNEFLSTQSPIVEMNQEECVTETLRIIDKLRKIGRENTSQLLRAIWGELTVTKIIDFGTKGKSNEETLEFLRKLVGKESQSFERLNNIYTLVKELDLEEKVIIDPSITRGLDYYTGFVCETFVSGFEDIGSVCSGGRYNNLTKMFSDEDMKGVGASVGLDRLLSILEEAITDITGSKILKIVILPQISEALGYCHKLQMQFSKENFSVQVYPLFGEMTNNKMKQFFKYTEKVHADFLCMIGSQELEDNTITIKSQETREQITESNFLRIMEWIKHTQE